VTARQPEPAAIAWLPLSIACSIAAIVSVYPQAAMAGGRADHPAAMLLFWAMSAGFVRGVGFIPVRLLSRLMLSSGACLGTLALAALRMAALAAS